MRALPATRSGFRTVDRDPDPESAGRLLKELGGKMTECKRCAPSPTLAHTRTHARMCRAQCHAAARKVLRGRVSGRVLTRVTSLLVAVVCVRAFCAPSRAALLAWRRGAARRLIREYEKEARTDGQDPGAVSRKKAVRCSHTHTRARTDTPQP